MTSRSGSNSQRQRSRHGGDDPVAREHNDNDADDLHELIQDTVFGPYSPRTSPPPPRLPSLRTLAGRDRARERAGAISPSTSSATIIAATVASTRPQTRNWSSAAARRAERIRNLDEQLGSFDHQVLGRSAVGSRTPSTAHHRPHQFQRQTDATPRQHPRPTEYRRFRPVSLEDVVNTINHNDDDESNQIRTLLNLASQPSTPLPPPPPAPRLATIGSSDSLSRPHDFSDDNRRSKRRKVSANRLTPSNKLFRYGKYGQVEPGDLRMEIVSCDGGMFSNESSYSADNILKNDNSVYCTKGNRCNIVLCHQGATVFTLQELVIKAPASVNYSHPVREGMVFVAMDQDEVLDRTAHYQIQYAPLRREQADADDNEEEVEDDDDDVDDHGEPPEPSNIISVHHNYDGTTTLRSRRRLNEDAEEEQRTPQMPREFTTNQPEFHITTECSDDEDDLLLDHRRYRLHRTPNRIGSLPFETPGSDSEEPGSPFGSNAFNPFHNTDRLLARASELTQAWEAYASATQEAVRAVGGEMLAPHARFFIEKKKSKCTIRFDPPVSGRFILLKMWSSHHDPSGNIDIQSVITRGFAGPRYFPAVELG